MAARLCFPCFDSVLFPVGAASLGQSLRARFSSPTPPMLRCNNIVSCEGSLYEHPFWGPDYLLVKLSVIPLCFF